MSAFPQLKRLYLQKGQATDNGLSSLTRLNHLEVLLVWDASSLTDAGIANFAGLKKTQGAAPEQCSARRRSVGCFRPNPQLEDSQPLW